MGTAPRSPIRLWDWLNLYLSGGLLIAFLVAHIVVIHYTASSGAGITFDSVATRLRTPIFAFLDLGLLTLALYHGLAGTRRIVVDLEVVGPRGLRVVSAGLAILGLAGLYQGVLIWRAFAGIG